MIRKFVIILLLLIVSEAFSQKESVINFTEHGYDFSITTSDSCTYEYLKTGTRVTDSYILNINLIHKGEEIMFHVKLNTNTSIKDIEESVSKPSFFRKEPMQIFEKTDRKIIAYQENEGVKMYRLYYLKPSKSNSNTLFQTHYKNTYSLEAVQYIENLIK